MYVNTNQATAGQFGLVLSLNPGSSFPTGTSVVLHVSFVASPSAAGGFAPAFTDYPVIREICNSTALALPAVYLDYQMPVDLLPRLTGRFAGGSVVLSWPAVARDFVLQETIADSPLPGLWTNSAATPLLSNDQQLVTFPLASGNKFFRLYRP